VLPIALGLLPFAFAIAAAVRASGIPVLAGWAGAPLIFAGAAQLTAVQMLGAGAAPLVIVASALAVNARVLMYGAAAAPWFRTAPLRRRLLLALPLIDPLYLPCAARFRRGDLDAGEREAYYVGAALLQGAAWTAGQGVALLVGATLPPALALDVAAPLAFAALLATAVVGRGAVVAAATGAVVAVMAVGLPFQSAVLLAAAAGVAAGTAHDRAGRSRDRSMVDPARS
jgi:predicted branched-subunit amino acid permease